MVADLRGERERWTDTLAERVRAGLAPAGLDLGTTLAGWVIADELTVAVMLARIACEDSVATPPLETAQWLRESGLAAASVTPNILEQDLVLPVYRRFREDGAPWERWWDAFGLEVLLCELWAGRRRANHPELTVRTELQTFWRMSASLAAEFPVAADPYALLPPSLTQSSAAGAVSELLQEMADAGQFFPLSGEDAVGELPALADRADLCEVYTRLRLWMELRALADGTPEDPVETLADDILLWGEEFRAFLSSLTAYELEMFRARNLDEIYRERCLNAGKNKFDVWLHLPDALPWRSDQPVPTWISELVIGRGARSYRTNVAAYPLWFAVAESDEVEQALLALAVIGREYGFGISIDDEGFHISLRVAPTQGDSERISVSYIYGLDEVDTVWQLMHLAMARTLRLTVLRLSGDGEMSVAGALHLAYDDKVAGRALESSTEAMRRLVGEDTERLLFRREGIDGTDRTEEIAEAAFAINDLAKGEDLYEERLAPDIGQPEALALRTASDEVARLRAQRARALLDGEDVLPYEEALALAVERRVMAMETWRGVKGPDYLTAAALDPGSAFVHLFLQDMADYPALGAVVHHPAEGLPPYELFDSVLLGLDSAIEASAQPWTALGELISPVVRRLLQRGVTRLYLSPTSPFDRLPVHLAQIDDGTLLLDHFDSIIYLPSSILLKLPGRPRAHPQRASLVVAHSGAGSGVPGLNPLGGTSIEVELLTMLHLDTTVLMDDAATPDAVLRALESADIVHFTCHGFTHPDRWASGLILQGTSLGTATLTASRVLADADLSGVELVVLNACRTGTYDSAARSVQTLRGVEAAFLARGARLVISTISEITDLEGIVFSALLHDALARAAAPPDAFSAVIAYLRAHAWRACSPSPLFAKAERLLDRVLVNWRTFLTAYAAQDPYFWGAFKISGVR